MSTSDTGSVLLESSSAEDQAKVRRPAVFYGNACWAGVTALAMVSIAAICSVLAFRLLQPQPAATKAFAADAGINAPALPACPVGVLEPSQSPCIIQLNGSLLLLSGLGQPIAPLSLSAESSTASASASASAGAAISLSADGAGFRIRRTGLYQLDAQVTFRDAAFADNAAAYLLANGRHVAQCHRYSPAVAAAADAFVPCPMTIVRRLAAGDLVTLAAEGFLRVAAERSLTYLAVSALPPPVRRQRASGQVVERVGSGAVQ